MSIAPAPAPAMFISDAARAELLSRLEKLDDRTARGIREWVEHLADHPNTPLVVEELPRRPRFPRMHSRSIMWDSWANGKHYDYCFQSNEMCPDQFVLVQKWCRENIMGRWALKIRERSSYRKQTQVCFIKVFFNDPQAVVALKFKWSEFVDLYEFFTSRHGARLMIAPSGTVYDYRKKEVISKAQHRNIDRIRKVY